MTMRRALRQMSAKAERSGEGQGEALSEPGSDEALPPGCEPEDTVPGLLTAVLARENMQQAWKRVRANKGAAGIDGLGIDETMERLVWEWLINSDFVTNRVPARANDAAREPKRQNSVVNTPDSGMKGRSRLRNAQVLFVSEMSRFLIAPAGAIP